MKQLLYPKRKAASVNDPWAALQRDCLGAFDATFDEATVKNLYGMQLSQLENFLKQHKVAQTKLKQQLQEAEQRCEKVCITANVLNYTDKRYNVHILTILYYNLMKPIKF